MIRLAAFIVVLCLCFRPAVPSSAGHASCAQCVFTGIDVLERQHFKLLQQLSTRHGGRLRIGLMTNQTGLDAAGRRTVDVLFQDAASAGLTVTTLFSPEHGMSGVLDTAHVNGGQHFGIADSRDLKTGLPIISLFGDSDAQRHPQPQQMRSLDAVSHRPARCRRSLLHLRDGGGIFSRGRRETGTEIVVLDRPNPSTALRCKARCRPTTRAISTTRRCRCVTG